MQPNNPTHIVVVLDESGSMQGNAAETIGAFNKFLEEQKKLPGRCLLSLVKFSDNDTPVHQRLDLTKVPALDSKTYAPNGYTALLDAVGRAIEFAEKDSEVIVCIVTDGGENASRSYTHERIKELIAQKTKAGWNFTYLSADVGAFQHGAALGINAANIARSVNSAQGLAAATMTASYAATQYRGGRKLLDAGELANAYSENLSKPTA